MNHTNSFLWYLTSVIFMSRCNAIWKKQQFLCKEHCHWRFHLKCGKPLSPSTLNVVIRNPKLIDGSVITFPCFSFLLALEKRQPVAHVLFHCELRVTGCVNGCCCSAPLPFADPLVFSVKLLRAWLAFGKVSSNCASASASLSCFSPGPGLFLATVELWLLYTRMICGQHVWGASSLCFYFRSDDNIGNLSSF